MSLYIGCTEAVYQPRRFWGLCTEAVYQPRRIGDCVLKLCISQVDLDQVSVWKRGKFFTINAGQTV